VEKKTKGRITSRPSTLANDSPAFECEPALPRNVREFNTLFLATTWDLSLAALPGLYEPLNQSCRLF